MKRFLLLACIGASPIAAQPLDLHAGYGHDVAFTEPFQPWLMRGFAIGPDGLVYVGLGSDLLEVDDRGRRTVLRQFSLSTGVGLVARDRQSGDLFYTESRTDLMWRRDLDTGVEILGTAPGWAFDLAVAPDGLVWCSANPAWPAVQAQSGIYFVDHIGGAHQEVVSLQGPSGPLVFDAQGNLYYATQSPVYPNPAGSVSILRFDDAQLKASLQSGVPILEAQGTVVLSGLDGAYDLEFDDRGRLYWTDPQKGGIGRSLPGLVGLDPTPLLARTQLPDATVALGLEFVDGGVPTFDPYQPDHGGGLYVHLNDWAFRGEVVRISTQRPITLSSPTQTAGRGPVTFVLQNLPPNGIAWLCGSPLPPVPERPLFWWNGTPFWTGFDTSVAPLSLLLPVDAQGNAQIVIPYGGGLSGTTYFQTIGLESLTASWPIASSSVYALTLLP